MIGKRKIETLQPFLSIVFAFSLGFLWGSCFQKGKEGEISATESGSPPTRNSTEKTVSPYPDFTELVEKVSPAVVNIWTTKKVRQPLNPFGDFEDLPPPFQEFFRRFFAPEGVPQPRREFKQYSLGSGFIIDPEGYVVTNHHVIQEADEIKITTASGKSYDVILVGKDPKTDLTLLKIREKGSYPYLVFGDSDATKVGEWVIAVGNPFGLSHTVTLGIVSAKGRTIRQGPYEDFIQTDASINPGNSGGPLINVRGEVIGVNTAIYSRTGQSAGIGFAIPSKVAKYVIEELKLHKRVSRGYLGVLIQPVDENIARSLGLKEPVGALVTSVFPGTPAEKAGIQVGDVIVRFNGEEIHRFNELPVKVSTTPPGKKVKVAYFREGKEYEVEVVLGELPEEGTQESSSSPPPSTPSPQKEESSVILGMTVRMTRPEEMKDLQLSSPQVIVEDVDPDSPAGEAGIQRGDLILEVNRTPVRSIEDLRKIVSRSKGKKEETLLFFLRRGDQNLFVGVPLK